MRTFVLALVVLAQSSVALQSLSAVDLTVGDDLSIDQARLLTDRLLTAFEETSAFDVTTTDERDARLSRAFRMRTCAETPCAVEIGERIGVDFVLVGSIKSDAGGWTIEISAVNVAANSEVAFVRSTLVGDEGDLLEAVTSLARPLASVLAPDVETPVVVPPPSQPTGERDIVFGRVWDFIEGEDDIESTILDRTNYERRRQNLNIVEWDDDLAQAARQHSEEMGRLGYFLHTSPVPRWTEPNDRIHGAGLTDFESGENIAYAEGFPRDELADFFMDKWMRSTGHRENILNGSYTHLGVGVVKVGGAYFATQVFVNRSLEFDRITVAPSSGTLVVEFSGRFLGSGGEVAAWVDGDFQNMNTLGDGSFNGSVHLSSAGLHTITFGVSSGHSGRYDIRNAIGIDTRRSGSDMFVAPDL
jgi:uncharacterized protein YkwD